MVDFIMATLIILIGMQFMAIAELRDKLELAQKDAEQLKQVLRDFYGDN